MYSLVSITEEERVAHSVLVKEETHAVLQVADAKNLSRMLHLTLQLVEAGVPLILDLNLMDEAEKAGASLNVETLQQELGIPVVATVAVEGRGIDALKASIVHPRQPDHSLTGYGAALEGAIKSLEEAIEGDYAISKRAVALLLLQEDPEMRALVRSKTDGGLGSLEKIIDEAKGMYSQPLAYVITLARQWAINRILERSTVSPVGNLPARLCKVSSTTVALRQEGMKEAEKAVRRLRVFSSTCCRRTWKRAFALSSVTSGCAPTESRYPRGHAAGRKAGS